MTGTLATLSLLIITWVVYGVISVKISARSPIAGTVFGITLGILLLIPTVCAIVKWLGSIT